MAEVSSAAEATISVPTDQAPDADVPTEPDTELNGSKAEKTTEPAKAAAEDVTPEGNGDGASAENKDGEIDMYAYTKDGKFTSEIFKIEISNLPYRVGFGQLKKRLQNIGIKPVKVKMVDGGKSGNAFVTFRNDEERDDAMTKCDGHQWKGRNWTVKKAAPAADPLARKRKMDSEHEGGPRQKQAKEEESDIPPADRLNQAVTPLYNLPYDEQLKKKQDEIKAYLKRLGRDLQYNNNTMAAYLTIQRQQNDGHICPLDPIKPSPQINDYRNKCEFTIGKSPDGKDNTVGFRLGRYNKGIITVVEVDACVHVPTSMKNVTKALQTYLQGTSKYAAYDPEERSGHWRQVTLRTNQQGAIMMMVAFHPQALSQEEVTAEREQLATYFRSGDGSGCDVTSMYFIVETERISEPKQNEYLFGDKHIEEELLGVKFRISPAAFFQVNTKAAEVLYKTVSDWSCVSPETVLLDVCCGTGTIGLTMAKLVSKTVGVELCPEAVEDAKVNAALNDIKNAEFFCSKAEQHLPGYIRGLNSVPVVAVVDPPRGGLHADVVRAIRKCGLVKRVVYVSCNPNGAKQNIIDFTRLESKRMQGPAFRLVQAVAVDMFPHTPHCELVMLLDREMSVKEATEAVRLKKKQAAESAAPPSTDSEKKMEAEGAAPPSTDSEKKMEAESAAHPSTDSEKKMEAESAAHPSTDSEKKMEAESAAHPSTDSEPPTQIQESESPAADDSSKTPIVEVESSSTQKASVQANSAAVDTTDAVKMDTGEGALTS